MAIPLVTNYPIRIEPTAIHISDFFVPFENALHLVVKKDSIVQVCFSGAMGLSHPLLIDFELQTAAKVSDFVKGLLKKTNVKLIPSCIPNANLHYTISPRTMSRLEYDSSIEREIDWHEQYQIYRWMATQHPRMNDVCKLFFTYYEYFQRTQRQEFPYHMEIIRNAHQCLVKTPLSPKEKETLISIGGGPSKKS